MRCWWRHSGELRTPVTSTIKAEYVQDMISYKVISPKPMTVQECVEGKGKMCGAIFVDEAFVNILRAILGEKWDRLSAAGKKSMINTEWEHGIKRVFDDSERDKVWNVTIPHEAFAKNTFEVETFATEGPAMRSDHVQLKTYVDILACLVQQLITDQIITEATSR